MGVGRGSHKKRFKASKNFIEGSKDLSPEQSGKKGEHDHPVLEDLWFGAAMNYVVVEVFFMKPSFASHCYVCLFRNFNSFSRKKSLFQFGWMTD